MSLNCTASSASEPAGRPWKRIRNRLGDETFAPADAFYGLGRAPVTGIKIFDSQTQTQAAPRRSQSPALMPSPKIEFGQIQERPNASVGRDALRDRRRQMDIDRSQASEAAFPFDVDSLIDGIRCPDQGATSASGASNRARIAAVASSWPGTVVSGASLPVR
jgi:hypothetical protein